MKRLFVIIFILSSFFALAQKNEYRYFSVKYGASNNFIFNPKSNNNLLQRTPLGDFEQVPQKFSGFTPGAEFELFFHFDAKNDVFGIVVGGGIKNYGNSIRYSTMDNQFSVFDQYRATAVVIPIFIKFNPAGIYLNQAYFTFGAKTYINLMVYNIQDASWDEVNYVRQLSADEFRRQSTSIFLGVNYGAYYMDIEYQLRSLLNKNYRVLTPEGLVMPYQNYDYQSNIFFSMGMHLPFTRWLTMRSWTAEKIRRLFRGNR